MKEKTILTIFGGNFFLFLTSLEGFLRLGTQLLAFCAAGVSLSLLVYKERHTIRVILKGGEKSGEMKNASQTATKDEIGPNTPKNL